MKRIEGQARGVQIDIAGREGILSTKAAAGVETSVPILVTNTGTAAAEQVELSGSGQVVAQTPEPGAEIEPGNTCVLTLAREGRP